jgi:hypothetical protein
MAARTKNEYLADVRELLEISKKHDKLPEGPARNILYMVHLGLGRLEADLAGGEKERDSVAAYKRRRALGAGPLDQPIEFPA